MLNKDELEHYKKLLLTERAKLMGEIKKDGIPENFGSDVDHFEEKADEVEEFANEVALGSAFRGRINEIDAALNKMALGAYGLCDRCHQEISRKMLDAIPESALCESCKRTG